MKKHNKKNIRKNNYNGYNVYGQRCEARTVKLSERNALEQCLEVMRKVEIAHCEGRRLEYTLDWSAISEMERIRISQELDRITRLRGYHAASYRMAS